MSLLHHHNERVNGRVVMTKDMGNVNATRVESVDMMGAAAGVYQVRLQIGSDVHSIRFIVQRFPLFVKAFFCKCVKNRWYEEFKMIAFCQFTRKGSEVSQLTGRMSYDQNAEHFTNGCGFVLTFETKVMCPLVLIF